MTLPGRRFAKLLLELPATCYESFMDGSCDEFPPDAFAPTGDLWWRLRVAPGKKKQPFGAERRISAWLAFNRKVGEVFTMRDLRRALGEDDIPDDAEHLNRRLRNLRGDGWEIYSQRDDGSLAHVEYRIAKVGWHPGTGESRPKKGGISERMRALVLKRDKSTCAVCGIVEGDPYPDNPGRKAVLTAGHRVPDRRLGRNATAEDLQAECERCNRAVRDEMPDPETLEEVLPEVRLMKRNEKKELLSWFEHGRSPSRVQQIYSRARRLTKVEQERLVDKLREMASGI